MKSFKQIILVCICLIAYLPLQAQEFQSEKLDEYFDTLENNNKFMGSVAVAMGDDMVYYRGVGFCNMDIQNKPDKTSKYRIGSISKTFTAVLTMKAIEENKLNLDSELSEFFPSFPQGNKITIKHLLQHKSGIHDFTSDSIYLTYYTQKKTREDMLQIISKDTLDFIPNTQFAYSNSNYVLLSFILEDVFQMSYADVLNQYIIEPLGLQHTSIDEYIEPKRNECLSYDLFYIDNYNASSETNASIPLGAGGISSSTEDLLKFGNALFSGELINTSSLEIMKDFEGNFGKGIFRVPFYNHSGYGHNGGIDSFSSILYYFPSKDLTYVLLSNGTNYNNNNISITVLSAAYDKMITIPDFTVYEIDQSILHSFVGNYTSEELPLDVEIFMDDNVLYAQATGQSSFPLEPKNDLALKNTNAGIELYFSKDYNTFVLKQSGLEYHYVREE